VWDSTEKKNRIMYRFVVASDDAIDDVVRQALQPRMTLMCDSQRLIDDI
jgi:hypothetical protein